MIFACSFVVDDGVPEGTQCAILVLIAVDSVASTDNTEDDKSMKRTHVAKQINW